MLALVKHSHTARDVSLTKQSRPASGPGDDKQDFVIFDVCRNIEYFNQDFPSAGVSLARSYGRR